MIKKSINMKELAEALKSFGFQLAAYVEEIKSKQQIYDDQNDDFILSIIPKNKSCYVNILNAENFRTAAEFNTILT